MTDFALSTGLVFLATVPVEDDFGSLGETMMYFRLKSSSTLRRTMKMRKSVLSDWRITRSMILLMMMDLLIG